MTTIDKVRDYNLGEMCKELISWSNTGLLDQDGFFKSFVDSLTDIPEYERIRVAEYAVKYEAMKYVVQNWD